MSELGVTQRRACLVLRQHRSTQRQVLTRPDDEAALTAEVVSLAVQYGRYGYRRIAALLRSCGWVVNVKRVERICLLAPFTSVASVHPGEGESSKR